MPSSLPQPTIADLVRAGGRALRGERDLYGDTRDGALYNHTVGPFAILCSRESDRDVDMFRDIYFADAEGWGLTRLIQQRTGVQRTLDAFGRGTCTFARPTDAGAGGKFLQGSRVRVAGSPPAVFQVAADTLAGATATSVTVPIEATVAGTGVAVQGATGLSLLDPLYDTTWAPVALSCADGTGFEAAADYRARALAQQAASRVGYLPNMIAACQQAGASYVLAFPSTYGLEIDDFDGDFGLNAIYVADANYQSSAALVNACAVALEPWRVGGADLWVGGITNVPLTVTMLVALTDVPARVPQVTVMRACAQAMLGASGDSSQGFTFSAAALTGAVAKASPYVQSAALPSVWAVGTSYSVGALVVPSPVNGQVYQCTTAGESGIEQPAFPTTPGATVDDGSLIWTCTPYPQLGIYAASELVTADPSLAEGRFPDVLPRYTLSAANVSFQLTGPL